MTGAVCDEHSDVVQRKIQDTRIDAVSVFSVPCLQRATHGTLKHYPVCTWEDGVLAWLSFANVRPSFYYNHTTICLFHRV